MAKKNRFKPGAGSGDAGTTDLARGRVRKTDNRITALALLDDLGAQLGLARARLGRSKSAAALKNVQLALQAAAAHTAGFDRAAELSEGLTELEARIEALSAGPAPAPGFVLPGSGETEARLHLARTRARLCELALWRTGSRPAARYVNRLSDYLFLLALKA